MTTKIGGRVKITHYINPHMFWFKFESSFFDNDPIHELENDIQIYASKFKRNDLDSVEYKQGDKVLVKNTAWNKWVRAEIDDIIEFQKETKYIVWAVDHGVPFSVTSKWIWPIPKCFDNINIQVVHYGGLANIVPAETCYDFEKSEIVQQIVNSWSLCATKTIADLLFDTAIVQFSSEFSIGKHYFGSVDILTHSGKKENANLLLLKMQHALESTNFLADLKRISTLRLNRWQNNDGNINKETINGLKFCIQSFPSKKNEFNHQVLRKVEDWKTRNERYHKQAHNNEDDVILTEGSSEVNCATTLKVTSKDILDLSEDLANDNQNYMPCGLTHAKLDDVDSEKCFKSELRRKKFELPRLPNAEDELKNLEKMKTFEISDANVIPTITISDDDNGVHNNCSLSCARLNDTDSAKLKNSKCDESSRLSSASSSISVPYNMPLSFFEKLIAKKKLAKMHSKKCEQKSELNLIPVGFHLNDLNTLKTSKNAGQLKRTRTTGKVTRNDLFGDNN